MIVKLRRKIVSVVLVTSLLLLILVLSYVFYSTREALMSDPKGSFQWVLDDIKQEQYYGVPKGSPRPMAIFFQNEEGELSLSSQDFHYIPEEELFHYAELLAAMQDGFRYYHDVQNSRLLACRVETLETTRIIMMTDVSLNNNILKVFQKNSIVASIAAFCVILCLGIIFARWVVRPIAQAQEAQQNFFAAASHDLKTPLTVMLSNLPLLQEAQDEEEREQYGANIQASAEQMRYLVQNMLESIQFESLAMSRASMPQESLDFGYQVQKLLAGFEALYFEQGHTLRYDIAPELKVKGNSSALDRVVGILLDNALKYSDQGSEIYVQMKAQGGNVQLSVRSASEPIAKEELQKIFQPFYRVDASRSDRSSYGLGLSIANNIVTAHNGTIKATAGDHENTFFVTLPKL